MPNIYKDLNKTLIILDGIDEIPDIEYFKSKLVNFLGNEISDKYKCIISCRTNIFESFVNDIPGFKKYYLKDLSREQCIELLKHNIGETIQNLDFSDEVYRFLKTPFQVEILANYIKENNKLPQNISEVWEVYINSRLKIDKKDKLVKLSLNIPLIKSISKKMSLINELTNVNIITDEKLYEITKHNSFDFREFKKNPFLDKQFGYDNYFFEHKNIQEYFAASTLSELPIKNILDFIVINSANKSQPSLFNTITFLLNIVENDNKEKLIEWFVVNEPEILFKADKNRVENYRVKVFQDYFNNHCITKSFWITTNSPFSVKEIADFADCKENYDFLTAIIINDKLHFRIIISALEVISFFKIENYDSDFLKNELYFLLEKNIQKTTKAKILSCIKQLKFHKCDSIYLKKIFELFKVETNKMICVELLFLINDLEFVDDYIWYIKEEFFREYEINRREIEDRVLRGNKWLINEIIVRIKSSETFIEIAKYYFEYSDKIHYKQNNVDKIIDRCLFFDSLEEDFFIRLLNSIKLNKKLFFKENNLKLLIIKAKPKSQVQAFDFLISNCDFSEIRFFLASITNEFTIKIVIDKFVEGVINIDEIDYFRNTISNHGNRKLAESFNQIMIEKGFVFNRKFISEDEFQKKNVEFKNRLQENFNLLFDKEVLIFRIEKIFLENGEVLSIENIRNIETKWYDTNGHDKLIDIEYSILEQISNAYKNIISINDVKELLINNDVIVLREIMYKLESNEESNEKLLFSEYQKGFIADWCKINAETIEFDKIFIISEKNYFNLGVDYEKLKVILYFTLKYDIEMSIDFLLNSLIFFDIDKHSGEEENFYNLKSRITNLELFNERVIENLLSKKMISFSLNRHIEYAVNNNLTKTFSSVREYFLKDNFIDDKTLRKYIELTFDFELLKKMCSDIDQYSCWVAIKILQENTKYKDFCEKIAVNYLEMNIMNSKKQFNSNALSILFELNSITALNYIDSFLKGDSNRSISENSYFNFNKIEDYNILHTLFKQFYGVKRDIEIRFSGLSNFLINYVSNISKSDDGYKMTKSKLNEIKEKLEFDNYLNGIFYINLLIDESHKSYINYKSKPLSFKDALKKIESIL